MEGRAWCQWCGYRIHYVFGAWELVRRPQSFEDNPGWANYYRCPKAPRHWHEPVHEKPNVRRPKGTTAKK